MPEALRVKLLGEASTPNDYHHTKSHPCDLIKVGRKEDGKWLCQRAKNGLKCLSGMKSINDSKFFQGWKCEKE